MKGKDTYAAPLFRLLKWVIGLLFCWYLYRLLAAESTPWSEVDLMGFFRKADLWLLLGVILLSPMNLYIELLKWRLLLKSDVPFWWGIRAICTGAMAGLVSLHGIGDFAGRILYLPADQRIKGSWASIAGGVIAFYAIMIFSIPFFPLIFEIKGLGISAGWLVFLKVTSWIIVVALLVFYTRARYLPGIFSGFKFFKAWKSSFEDLGNYAQSAMLKVLALSSLRFLVANVQLNILWAVFGFDFGLLEGLMWSIALFGFLSLVPTVFITEIGVRGGVALWLLGDFAAHSWQVLLPSYLLWTLNVLFPAFIGWVSMWFLNRGRK